jgi:hypothetical protein
MTARIDPPCDVAQPADYGPSLLPPDVRKMLDNLSPAAKAQMLDVGQPYVSYLLTLPCRTFAQAVRDVSKYRDLPEWIYDELRLRRQSATIISLAHARSARAGRR